MSRQHQTTTKNKPITEKNKDSEQESMILAKSKQTEADALTLADNQKISPAKEKHPKSGAKNKKIKQKAYEKELEKLQAQLVHLQEWVKKSGQRICIVFEGRDGAGKGGTIKVLTERLSPRVVKTIALPAPSPKEKSQMYFQRYIRHMPAAGEIVIFDRSWYNRAGVEKVMGFCSKEENVEFLEQVSSVEKYIVSSGIILLKYWLEVDMDEQEKRMKERVNDPRKTWKLSDIDIQSYSRWYDYSRARDEMIKASDTAWAPWFVADSNHKKSVRLNILSHLLGQIPYKKTTVKKVKFPKRQDVDGYVEPDYPYHKVPKQY